MTTRHPDIELLVDYATGSLPLAQCIAITTHLQFCEHCRSQVESLKAIGGEMLNTSETMAVSDDLLESILDAIEMPLDPEPENASPARTDVAADLPDYVQRLLPETLSWRSLSPSLKVAPIAVGEQRHELALHRIMAGGKAPSHTHRGNEFTVVLKGSFSDEHGVYQEGDFLVKGPEDAHRPIASQHEDCICLSVLDAPIKLTGWKRALNPFMGFHPS